MSDEYDVVAKGKLKLKNDSEFKKKKKSKKKSKDKNKEKIKNIIKDDEEQKLDNEKPRLPRQLTKAERSFKEMQDKMQTKRILDKASTTHKQRVEKFNEHLDSLTEHFDIPKVSWTK